MLLIPVAVRKYMKADVVFSFFIVAASASALAQWSGSGTVITEAICATDGRTPATAWPVMIACMYSPLPKLDANANAPFWQSPVATDVVKTMINVNVRYPGDETVRKREVDIARRVNTITLTTREASIRFG